MAMIAGAVPCIACTGDQIPLLHGIAFLYAHLIAMGIQGAPPVFVAQQNQISIAGTAAQRIITSFFHHTVGHSQHPAALGRSQEMCIRDSPGGF